MRLAHPTKNRKGFSAHGKIAQKNNSIQLLNGRAHYPLPLLLVFRHKHTKLGSSQWTAYFSRFHCCGYSLRCILLKSIWGPQPPSFPMWLTEGKLFTGPAGEKHSWSVEGAVVLFCVLRETSAGVGSRVKPRVQIAAGSFWYSLFFFRCPTDRHRCSGSRPSGNIHRITSCLEICRQSKSTTLVSLLRCFISPGTELLF